MLKGEEPGWELRKDCLQAGTPGRLGEQVWADERGSRSARITRGKAKRQDSARFNYSQKEPSWLETFSSPTTAWCSKHFTVAVNIKCCFVTQAYAWNIQWQLTAMNNYFKITAVKRSWGSGPSSVHLGMNYGLSKSTGNQARHSFQLWSFIGHIPDTSFYWWEWWLASRLIYMQVPTWPFSCQQNLLVSSSWLRASV